MPLCHELWRYQCPLSLKSCLLQSCCWREKTWHFLDNLWFVRFTWWKAVGFSALPVPDKMCERDVCCSLHLYWWKPDLRSFFTRRLFSWQAPKRRRARLKIAGMCMRTLPHSRPRFVPAIVCLTYIPLWHVICNVMLLTVSHYYAACIIFIVPGLFKQKLHPLVWTILTTSFCSSK